MFARQRVDLGREFSNLAYGLELSCRSSGRLAWALVRRVMVVFRWVFVLMIHVPGFYRQHAPGRRDRVSQLDVRYMDYGHPPSWM